MAHVMKPHRLFPQYKSTETSAAFTSDFWAPEQQQELLETLSDSDDPTDVSTQAASVFESDDTSAEEYEVDATL